MLPLRDPVSAQDDFLTFSVAATAGFRVSRAPANRTALIRLTGSPSEIVHRPLDGIRDEELPRKQLYAQRWRFSEQRLANRLGEVPRRPLDVTLRDTVGARSVAASADERA